MSGTGLNVRLAKNKASLEDLILKIERFFISFNPDEFVDIEDMQNLINRKPEFKRRFYLYNMDCLELANLFNKPKEPWNDDYKLLISKLIRNPIKWELFNDLLEIEDSKKSEINSIMNNIDDFDSEIEEEESDNDFKMKTKLTELFQDEDYPDNQQDIPQSKYSILFD